MENGVFGGMLDIFNPGFGELIFHLQSHLHFTLLISHIHSLFTQPQASSKHHTFSQRFPHFPSNLSTPTDPEFGRHWPFFFLIYFLFFKNLLVWFFGVKCSLFDFLFSIFCFQFETFCVCIVQSVFIEVFFWRFVHENSTSFSFNLLLSGMHFLRWGGH